MPDTPTPTLPRPKICGLCQYFRPIAGNQFGNCHGYPPAVERAPTGTPYSCRPQVLPSDAACTLFAEK
jgi:hypothetical protein